MFVRRSPDVDYQTLNLRTFENFLAEFDEEGGGGAYILLKIQGALGHGGLEQVRPGSTDFANMQRFLAVLGEELAPPPSLTVETLFDTVLMASPRKTLRRAALIFAGRIPTDAEYAAVESGSESALRRAVRRLMTGTQFHEFLIRASNDRLLTDRDTLAELSTEARTLSNTRQRALSPQQEWRTSIDTERAWDEFTLLAEQRAARREASTAGADCLRGGERPPVHGDPHCRLHHGEPDGGRGLWRLHPSSTTPRTSTSSGRRGSSATTAEGDDFESEGRS